MVTEVTAATAGPALLHIADRVLHRPLLIHQTKADIILEVLKGRLPIGQVEFGPLPADANRFLGGRAREDGSYRLNMAANGIAIIPIVGSLVNRGAWIGTNSGLTSYEGIAALLRDAADDPSVRSIILDLDSPGGEATGMFSVAEQVRAIGKKKHVTAFVNDMAASAAYGIASAANEIVVSPTSVVGSIGVVLTHLDKSGQMEKNGIKPTLIYAGDHKVDGNPFGPLSDTVKADLKAEVMKFYDQFVALVERGRPGMTDASIRDTKARTYIGQDAIDRGLADRIATLDDLLNDQPSMAHGAATQRSGIAMSNATNAAAPQAENAGASAANAAASVNASAAIEAARLEGAKAERARIASILNSEAAQGREGAAKALALDTDINSEDAVKVLSASPKSEAASPIKTIAQRAEAEASFGSDKSAAAEKADASSIWKNAVKSANASIGVSR